MTKKACGKKLLSAPMPTVLVGANVNGVPNYMTAAWYSIACMAPPMVVVAINQTRHTLEGIRETKSFSINIPSIHQVEATDYCGITSGKNSDKSKIFANFYGNLKTAPMIEECPINLECRLFTITECGSHVLCVGEVVDTFAKDDIFSDDTPDVRKVDPIIYLNGKYYRVGEYLNDAFSVGKNLKKKK